MPKIPIIMICMHRTNRSFVVIPYIEDRKLGIPLASGDFVRLSEEEMRQRGRTIVSDCFDAFLVRDVADQSEVEKMSDAQKKEFEAEHKLISACLQRGSEIWLDPMRVTKAGCKGHAGLGLQFRTVVTWPISDEEFFVATMRAFQKAP